MVIMKQGRKFTAVPLVNNATSPVTALHSGLEATVDVEIGISAPSVMDSSLYNY